MTALNPSFKADAAETMRPEPGGSQIATRTAWWRDIQLHRPVTPL